MEQSRSELRGRKKRRSPFKRIFAFIFILFIGLVGYGIFTYWQGTQIADGEASSEPFDGSAYDGGRMNVLLLGVDSRGEEKSRTDTMMVASWDPESNDVRLISLMRDIYAEIPGYQSYKLNTAYYLGGADLTRQTIEGMFGIPLHHYALIDFTSFETMVDILAPNGIEIDVEKDMSEEIGVELKQGVHQLNGQELLGYARFRKDEEGDFGRVRRQQVVIEALSNEVTSVGNLHRLPKFAGALNGYIQTDITNTDKLNYLLDVALGGSPEVERLTIPREGEYRYNSYSHAGSVIEIDQQAAQAAIAEFLE
ncbi:LCP family protein [Chryseomicrobium aureum]|uniref:LCP family protein n=1 Tax=Chryseomicrobium aureum TaxID=1441723 RepID=UPI00195E7DFD|nr:LCP family protein [Chryseomicrobium aureum]MBM7705635.1 LCP family protein required for cell wall assembly [Chryseomicrobium aureum]